MPVPVRPRLAVLARVWVSSGREYVDTELLLFPAAPLVLGAGRGVCARGTRGALASSVPHWGRTARPLPPVPPRESAARPAQTCAWGNYGFSFVRQAATFLVETTVAGRGVMVLN